MIRLELPRGFARVFGTVVTPADRVLQATSRWLGRLVPDSLLADPDLDAHRAAWSPAAPAVTYSPDRSGPATFTAATRLVVSNPHRPEQVTPGDVVTSNLTAGELVAGAATGQLRHGLTWHHVDGSTTEQLLDVRAPVAEQVTRANLMPNPSFEVDAAGWAPVRGSLVASTSAYVTAGTKVGLYASTDASTTNGNYLGAGPTLEAAVVAGESLTCSLDLTPSGTSGGLFGIWVQWYNAAGTFLSTSPVVTQTVPNLTTARLSVVAQAPATATRGRVYVGARNRALAVGDTFRVDAVLVEKGTAALPYFDGDTPDTWDGLDGLDHRWTGTAHASTSQAYVPRHIGATRTPRVVPDDVDGVHLWVETTAGTWYASRVDAELASSSASASTTTIRRGRSSATAAGEPTTLSTTLHLAGVPAMTTGDDVALAVPYGFAGEGTRFVGRVSDADAVITPTGPHQLPIVAVGPLSRLSAYTVGDAPWPAESGLERAARVLDLVLALDSSLPIVSPAGTGGRRVAARDVDAQPADRLLAELARDAGVRVVELRDGTITAQAPRPRSTAPVATLTPAHFAKPLRMPQLPAPTAVSVEYGPSSAREVVVIDATPPGAPRAEVPELSTILADRDAATELALATIAPSLSPAWTVRGLTVDLVRLRERNAPGDFDLVDQLLGLELGDVLQLDELPLAAPRLAGAGLVVVEGWTETIGPDQWRLELAVVDAPAVMAPATWDDVDAGTEPWTAGDVVTPWAAAGLVLS